MLTNDDYDDDINVNYSNSKQKYKIMMTISWKSV